jgi:hypothetical protein
MFKEFEAQHLDITAMGAVFEKLGDDQLQQIYRQAQKSLSDRYTALYQEILQACQFFVPVAEDTRTVCDTSLASNTRPRLLHIGVLTLRKRMPLDKILTNLAGVASAMADRVNVKIEVVYGAEEVQIFLRMEIPDFIVIPGIARPEDTEAKQATIPSVLDAIQYATDYRVAIQTDVGAPPAAGEEEEGP